MSFNTQITMATTQMDIFREYKVVMIGNGGAGKSSIVKRLCFGEFSPQYVPTLGVEVHPVRFNTNYGIVQFNVWDCAGQERFSGLRDGYYIQSDACIGVFEKGNRLFVRMLKQELNHESLFNIPMVTVLNKKEIQTNNDDVHTDVFPEAISVSAKNNDNLEEPFLVLARRLTGLNDLCFVPMKAKSVLEADLS